MRVHETWCKPNQCCCMLSSTNKRNIDFSWAQRSVVSKPLFEKVFFQDKCFFQNCLKQFCLKGKYCFQTSARGSGFEKEVLFPNLCLEHFFWRNVCFQTSAWGSFFPRDMLFRKIFFFAPGAVRHQAQSLGGQKHWLPIAPSTTTQKTAKQPQPPHERHQSPRPGLASLEKHDQQRCNKGISGAASQPYQKIPKKSPICTIQQTRQFARNQQKHRPRRSKQIYQRVQIYWP